MKRTGKNSPQSRKSDDTLIYIFLFILFIGLVGGLMWYLWPAEKEWNLDYEKELGKELTSPTAKDISKLISGNRSRIKSARRVLEGKKRRKLSAEESKEVKAELDKISNEFEEWLKTIDLRKLEKDGREEALASIYRTVYEHGKVTVRLKAKTSSSLAPEQVAKQVKVQEEWEASTTEEEIKKVMNEWTTKWYWRARKEIIRPGREKLRENLWPTWENAKKIEEPTEAQIKAWKKMYKRDVGDLSKPPTVEFEGCWGFLTEEDKKDSSEGTETWGLTKPFSNVYRVVPSGSLDLKEDEEKAAFPGFKEFLYLEKNRYKTGVGFEKKLFFGRLGYEEWITDLDKEGRWHSFDTCFDEAIETIAHELAHTIVNTARFEYDGEEGGGHGKLFYDLLKEIEEMIKKSPDFPEFEAWWYKPKEEHKEWAADNVLLVDKKGHWDEWKYWYIGGGVGILVIGLAMVVIFWDGSGSKKNVKN